ncbi:unnamed protein product, partial [Rotaria magnacalcarata]
MPQSFQVPQQVISAPPPPVYIPAQPQPQQPAPQSYGLPPPAFQPSGGSVSSFAQSFQAAPQSFQAAPQSFQAAPQSF